MNTRWQNFAHCTLKPSKQELQTASGDDLPSDITFKMLFILPPKVKQGAYFTVKLCSREKKKQKCHIIFPSTPASLIKPLCCLIGREGRGGQGGREGGLPSAAARHQVLRGRRQRLQGPAETEEGLGDSAHQRGGELSRTVPSDARQRK